MLYCTFTYAQLYILTPLYIKTSLIEYCIRNSYSLFPGFFKVSKAVQACLSITHSLIKQSMTAAPSRTQDYLGVKLRGITLVPPPTAI